MEKKMEKKKRKKMKKGIKMHFYIYHHCLSVYFEKWKKK